MHHFYFFDYFIRDIYTKIFLIFGTMINLIRPLFKCSELFMKFGLRITS